jgi:hypothetical protein
MLLFTSDASILDAQKLCFPLVQLMVAILHYQTTSVGEEVELIATRLILPRFLLIPILTHLLFPSYILFELILNPR